MNVFQIYPRLVFESNNRVYKFFKTNSEFKKELEKINSLPNFDHHDDLSKYKMSIVKILEIHDNFYVMQHAKGICLKNSNNINDYFLAGSWLKYFHERTLSKIDNKATLFGDFVNSHLYIDHINKEIIAIDPGSGIANFDEIEVDFSRFIVNILAKKNLQVLKIQNILNKFFNGYGINRLSFSRLDQQIKIRISKNFEKTVQLTPGFKGFYKACFLLFFSKMKYKFIKKYIKNIINNSQQRKN